MNILDIILLLCLTASFIQGIRKGFIAQAIAIVSIIAGVWISFRFANAVSGWLGQYIQGSEHLLRLVAFGLIIVAVSAGLWAIGKALEATIKIVMLGWLNKLLGGVFSILKSALTIGILILLFNSLNDSLHIVSEEYLAGSVLYTSLKEVASAVFPYLKNLLTIA